MSKDARRAACLQNLKEGIGRECRSIGDLIAVAVQVEAVLVSAGSWPADDRLFTGNVTPESLRSSVSAGLKEIGLTGAKLLGRNPS